MMPTPAATTYYFFGEDRDALFEHADALLQQGDAHALRLRLDVSEWTRIEEEQRNPSLFGVQPCYALIRNAEAATPKEGKQLLALIQSTQAPHRLIICAPEVSWKKAGHKAIRALKTIEQREFKTPSLHHFNRWLHDEIEHAGLHVDADALPQVSEALYGMRLAARQWIERLQLYQGQAHHPLTRQVMFQLLGEHAPDDLDVWVHQVLMRDKAALRLTHRLLYDQQVHEVQMHAWLSTRMQQLLMYRWHHAKRTPRPIQAARIFGNAVRLIPQESEQWRNADIFNSLQQIQDTEKQLKGAAIEDKRVILEALVRTMVCP